MSEAKRIPFNINNYVRVKLTERGMEALRRRHDELSQRAPSLGGFRPPKTDADGWSRWQLWDLMSQLGDDIIMGLPVPFETTIEFEVVP